MELPEAVCPVVDEKAPVAPVPVRVPDQIVDQIHHVKGVRVLLQHKRIAVKFVIGAVHVDRFHRYDAFLFRRDDPAFRDDYTFKLCRFIKNALCLETARNSGREEFRFHIPLIPILQETERIPLPDPCLRSDPLCADIACRVGGCDKLLILCGQSFPAQAHIRESAGE